MTKIIAVSKATDGNLVSEDLSYVDVCIAMLKRIREKFDIIIKGEPYLKNAPLSDIDLQEYKFKLPFSIAHFNISAEEEVEEFIKKTIRPYDVWFNDYSDYGLTLNNAHSYNMHADKNTWDYKKAELKDFPQLVPESTIFITLSFMEVQTVECLEFLSDLYEEFFVTFRYIPFICIVLSESSVFSCEKS